MMNPSEPNLCPECGKPVPLASQHQVCPCCLLRQALDSGTLVDAKSDPPGAPGPAAVPPPAPEEIADRFPQFEITECLGRGGMGVVYKARQKSLDRWVAIKILPPERVGEGTFAARFAREAATLAMLSHPNIVTIHDFGETGGLFFIVMEYVDGVNLRDLLREGKLDPRQALAIVPPVCEALQYAHDKGVVHRDIKPENILLDRDGRIKIADFGIAALIGAGGEGIGTPPYMAPEQAGAAAAVDHRADIYAVGVVFYEMLTGEQPNKDLLAPSKKVQIDVRLDEMVLRALEKEPERRYQTAGEFGMVVETMAGAGPGRSGMASSGLVKAEREVKRGGIVLVGRRNGRRVVVWRGVIHTFLVILGIMAILGWLVSLVRPLDPAVLIPLVLFPLMLTAGGVVLGLMTSLERLVGVDDSQSGRDRIDPSLAGQSPPRGMWRRWWWLLLVMVPVGMLLGLAAGGVWSYIVPKKYEASTKILCKPDPAANVPATKKQVQNGIMTGLTSAETLARLEARLELGKRWAMPTEDAIRVLGGMVTVDTTRGTEVFVVRARSRNPEECREIANEVLKAYQATPGINMVVVQAASLSQRPVAPNVPLVLTVATVAGIPLGLLLALPLMALLQRLVPERAAAAGAPSRRAENPGSPGPPPLPDKASAAEPFSGIGKPSNLAPQRPSLVPTVVLHAVLFAGVAGIFLLVVPRFANLFHEVGAQLPVITRFVLAPPPNWVVLGLPILLGLDVGCCHLARRLGARRGLFWWTVGVIVALVLVVAIAAAGLMLPLRKLTAELNSETAQARAQIEQKLRATRDALDGMAPAVVPELLRIRRQDGDAAAVARFLATDWSARPLFEPGSALGLSEDQFAALPAAERTASASEIYAGIEEVLKLAKVVERAGLETAETEDGTRAKPYFEALQRCGRALDRPGGLIVVRLVGQAVEKGAVKNLAALKPVVPAAEQDPAAEPP